MLVPDAGSPVGKGLASSVSALFPAAPGTSPGFRETLSSQWHAPPRAAEVGWEEKEFRVVIPSC